MRRWQTLSLVFLFFLTVVYGLVWISVSYSLMSLVDQAFKVKGVPNLTLKYNQPVIKGFPLNIGVRLNDLVLTDRSVSNGVSHVMFDFLDISYSIWSNRVQIRFSDRFEKRDRIVDANEAIYIFKKKYKLKQEFSLTSRQFLLTSLLKKKKITDSILHLDTIRFSLSDLEIDNAEGVRQYRNNGWIMLVARIVSQKAGLVVFDVNLDLANRPTFEQLSSVAASLPARRVIDLPYKAFTLQSNFSISSDSVTKINSLALRNLNLKTAELGLQANGIGRFSKDADPELDFTLVADSFLLLVKQLASDEGEAYAKIVDLASEIEQLSEPSGIGRLTLKLVTDSQGKIFLGSKPVEELLAKYIPQR